MSLLPGTAKPTQFDMVLSVTGGGVWRTIPEIQTLIVHRFDRLCSETGISARLRDIRATGREVLRRNRTKGSVEYHVAPAAPSGELF